MPEEELILECSCDEGIAPFRAILEGQRCVCVIKTREKDLGKIEVGTVILDVKSWKK